MSNNDEAILATIERQTGQLEKINQALDRLNSTTVGIEQHLRATGETALTDDVTAIKCSVGELKDLCGKIWNHFNPKS